MVSYGTIHPRHGAGGGADCTQVSIKSLGHVDRRRKCRLTPTSVTSKGRVGLPEVRPAVAPTEAGARVPQMVGAHTCIKRNFRRDPPLDTRANACSLQDAVEGSEPGLLDLVRLVL